MKAKVSIRTLIISIGVTMVVILLLTLSLVEECHTDNLKKGTISLEKYNLLEEELELVRRDAGNIQYKLYLTDKENRRLMEENERLVDENGIFTSMLGEIETTPCGSKILKLLWDDYKYE